jgi:two-component system, OmpR family, sensor histidine kinase BaeS
MTAGRLTRRVRRLTLDPLRQRVRRAGLSVRLFAAMGLVVLAGATTLLVVALLVAPEVFHNHLRMALGTIPADTQRHVDEAFTRAVLLSLGLAVVVALVAALSVTWLVARRIAVPVSDLAAAAEGLAVGHTDTRVTDPGLGPEFAALASSFNTTAAQLARTEQVRQRLLADLAHELRTPIASIEATVEAVADGILPADDRAWAALTDQTARVSRLVNDIAAVSRAEERALTIDMRPRPLAELAEQAASSIEARYANKGVALVVDIDPHTPQVAVDPHRFAEALANLLDNALRHTPPGGRVTIATARAHRWGGDVACLTVTDTGEGFDPAEADRIFERFYRTDRARTRGGAGSGIGLTITKAIVNAHRATITAHSDGPGHGATFDITLPAVSS